MAEHLNIIEGSKAEKYAALLPQIPSVVEHEPGAIANIAHVASMLHETSRSWWTGFYRVVPTENAEQLVLGPFQGPMACTRIPRGRGVCGTAWAEDKTQVVPDVEKCPGHIACSAASRSEIVVPIHDSNGRVSAVLDIDSAELNTFDAIDQLWLERIARILDK